MGGQNETVLEKPAPKSVATSELKLQKLRVHRSNSEVHFHDDKRKLKSVVSIADWFTLGRQLLGGRSKVIRQYDRLNGTKLEIRLREKKGKLLLEADLSPIQFDSSVEVLDV